VENGPQVGPLRLAVRSGQQPNHMVIITPTRLYGLTFYASPL
jgi:hypothetical protein